MIGIHQKTLKLIVFVNNLINLKNSLMKVILIKRKTGNDSPEELNPPEKQGIYKKIFKLIYFFVHFITVLIKNFNNRNY